MRPRRTLMIIALENEVDVEKEINMYGKCSDLCKSQEAE